LPEKPVKESMLVTLPKPATDYAGIPDAGINGIMTHAIA